MRGVVGSASLLAILWSLSLSPANAQVLASGQFDLPHTAEPGGPNFTFPITIPGTIPNIGTTVGATLILSLRDAGRPNQFCDPNDPAGGLFDGCAAIDWPFQGRRGINRIVLETTSGNREFHLRQGGILSAQPEPPGP